MSRPYRLTPAARRDLAGIWTFTAGTWDRDQADRYVRCIAEAFTGLADGTLPTRDAGYVRRGYRKVTIGAHVIYFRHESDSIEIVRILHGRMDVNRHL